MVNISEEDADDYTCVGVNAGKALSFHLIANIKIIPLLLMQKCFGSFKHKGDLITKDSTDILLPLLNTLTCIFTLLGLILINRCFHLHLMRYFVLQEGCQNKMFL